MTPHRTALPFQPNSKQEKKPQSHNLTHQNCSTLLHLYSMAVCCYQNHCALNEWNILYRPQGEICVGLKGVYIDRIIGSLTENKNSTHKYKEINTHSSFHNLIEKGIKYFLKRLYLHIGNPYRLPEGNNSSATILCASLRTDCTYNDSRDKFLIIMPPSTMLVADLNTFKCK